MENSKYKQVDRRSDLSVRDFQKDYLYGCTPVVIIDAIDVWKSKSIWTFDFFAQQFGETYVKLYRYDVVEQFTHDNTELVKLSDFINELLKGDWRTYPYYLRDNWSLFHQHPELIANHEVPRYFFDWFKFLPPFLRMPYPRIFIGPKGAVTPLHVDVWETHAWLAQLAGKKRWLLYPPGQKELLYDNQVRVEQPDYKKHPRFADASPLETIIGPGDTIFVPSSWAHWVESLDPTISLTYNYMGPGCFRSCLGNTLKTLSFLRLACFLGKRRSGATSRQST